MQYSKKLRTLIAGSAIAIATVGGVAGVAAAQSSGSAPTNTTAESPAYKSSVTAPNGPDTGKDNEGSESAALQPLAKVTPEQAKAAALAAVPGTANNVELENENGNVVYGVEVTDASGNTTDVKVDAGNGTVLAKEADQNDGGNEKAGANDTPEANDTPDAATAPTAGA